LGETFERRMIMHRFNIGDWVYAGRDYCFYGQIVDIYNETEEASIEFDNGPYGGGSLCFDLEDLVPAEPPTKLHTLPQYHFDREAMCDVYYDIFTTDESIELMSACCANTHLDEFSLFHFDDEFYILHRNSGVMINWYKHMGRTNTCNKPGFTLDDLREFMDKLRKDLVWNKVIEDNELLEEMANAGWEEEDW
jgi:hypothetical protein